MEDLWCHTEDQCIDTFVVLYLIAIHVISQLEDRPVYLRSEFPHELMHIHSC
jgi:hypothetical protein